MAAVLFFIAGIGAVAGAIGVISARNPFYSVLALVAHLISLAALFLLLRAEFVAAAQVIVYAGAVMVLYVFVVSYVGLRDEPWHTMGAPGGAALRGGAALFGGALAVELMIALLGTGLRAVDSRGAGYVPGFGSPGQIGDLLLTKFLFAFELASFLLLIAAVGAVVLARRRGEGEPEGAPEATSVIEALRLGSMAEAVGAPASTAATRLAELNEPDQGEGRGGGW
ncbi:MAG: NADH-quinone oxidoreductase subunit J [Actinobacteria bacterium]|nr:MAG: NADH-quinone oxidoreductase subunit J [Actinomycetota bacterium]